MATKEEHLANLQKQFGITPAETGSTTITETEAGKEEKQPEQSATANSTQTTTEKEETELSDDALLALLSKKGISVSSLNDLKQKEVEIDPVVAKEQREADKVHYGIKKGLFKQKDYDGFVVDSKDKKNLVYGEFYEDYKADDAKATDEEIQQAFFSKYALDEEERGTRKYKKGIAEIEAEADRILRNRYKGIFDLEADYSSFEQNALSERELNKKVSEGTSKYNKDVDEALAGFKKMSFNLPEIGEVEVELDDADFTALKSELTTEDLTRAQILADYDKDHLKEVVEMGVYKKNFQKIVHKAVAQAMLKAQKGVRGITKNDVATTVTDVTANMNDAQKKAYEIKKQQMGL